jgi:hypothetical protein
MIPTVFTEDAIVFPGIATDSEMLTVFALEVVADPVSDIASSIETVLTEDAIVFPGRATDSEMPTVFALEIVAEPLIVML